MKFSSSIYSLHSKVFGGELYVTLLTTMKSLILWNLPYKENRKENNCQYSLRCKGLPDPEAFVFLFLAKLSKIFHVGKALFVLVCLSFVSIAVYFYWFLEGQKQQLEQMEHATTDILNYLQIRKRSVAPYVL